MREMKVQSMSKRSLSDRAFRAASAACGGLLTLGWLATGAHAQAAKPLGAPVDPATHAAHVAAGAMPATPATVDPALAQQLSQLQAKLAQLESTVARTVQRQPVPVAALPAPGAMQGMFAPATAAPMPGMPGATPGAAPAAGGMAGMPAAGGGSMGMMGMMDKMMGMMDKMMPMAGGAMPAPASMPAAAMSPAPAMSGGGMGMMDMMKMGGMGGGGAMPAAAPAAPAPAMSGGMGMGMGKMEMAGMMGMSSMSSAPAGTLPQSALPGFPGASHLYHIGATGFFLDHPEHISLTIEQQLALNKAKEQALLAKATSDRLIQQAEQELWTLTAADQPDNAQIAAKIGEIEKLGGDARQRFISAVGVAAKVLNDEQRRILAGFATAAPVAPVATAAPVAATAPAAPMAPAAPAVPAAAPAAAAAAPPMAPGMSDM